MLYGIIEPHKIGLELQNLNKVPSPLKDVHSSISTGDSELLWVPVSISNDRLGRIPFSNHGRTSQGVVQSNSALNK